MSDFPVHPETAAAVEAVALQLESMGHAVEEAAPRYDFDAVIEHFGVAWFVGYGELFQSYAEDMGRLLDSSTLEPATLAILEAARNTPPINLLAAMDYFNNVRRDFGEFHTQYDMWLTPTTAQPSEPWGKYGQNQEGMSGEEYIRLTERPVQFTIPYNVTGYPAISLPLAQTSDGLPIGIQLGAAHGGEARLLRLAADLEETMPWIDRIPPIHVSNYGDG
jgi:amidase